MRVLCCALSLEGHVRPLLPLGTALVNAGHKVRVATGLDLHARIREAGLSPVAAGPTFADAFAATARLSGLDELSVTQRGGATFSVLPPEALTANAIAQEVEHLLRAGAYRHAAARLRAEIEAMPAPSETVPLLEELVYGLGRNVLRNQSSE